MKSVIIITGTPCIGKTTIARALTAKLNAEYINLTQLAKTYNLIKSEDTKRCTLVIDEEKMTQKLLEVIETSKNANIIIDGHYAAAVTPKEHVAHVFVLRRHPKELKEFMEKRGDSENKMWENLQAEIIDVSLSEAMESYGNRVCEFDVTKKTIEAVVEDVMAVLEKRKICVSSSVDWIAILEREGLLDKYLRTQNS
jgi:adenylate kinase